ncbi:hypothetical protein MB84_30085 (plasmid) [Pandoraea oxalativorans]|uniref:Gamma-soluble NSF attachment protein n=2 Tax=Pandoraea oxalativorans TaxID=573737 RepID=A0A0G3ICR4_9BURK|nr:hypothetical protein [Pandoraea oxalativorans]AKK25007.1 hypothetical protein MB84_30085 [Pandoraea oxalativorans]
MHFPTMSPTKSGPGVDFSAGFAEAHSAISAVLAALDFNDAQAVAAAQLSLQTQALALFPATCFDGVDPDRVGRALAALILSHGAGQRNQPMQWIASSANDALRTLSDRLTPTGQDALLGSLEYGQEDNEFSKYFAAADRHCLAGHLHHRWADTHPFAGGTGKTSEDAAAQAAPSAWAAAQAYRQAAGAYEQAGAAELATGAWQRVVDAATQAAAAYLRSYQPLKAADAYELVATANTQAGQPGPATDARRRASAAALTAANGYLLAGAPAQAADVYARAAEICTHTYERLAAADAWLKAADAYLRSDRPAQAVAAYRRAAELYTHEGRFASAAVAYVRGRQPKSAVKAWQQAARAYTETGQPARAGDACRSQADIFSAELGQPVKAAQAYELAATAYREAAMASAGANDSLAAASHYLMAAQAYKLAATAYHTIAKASAGAFDALAGALRDLMAARVYAATGQTMRATDADLAEQQDKWAIYAYQEAARAFNRAKEFSKAADAYALAELHPEAASACLKAASACLKEAKPLQAADAYFRVGFHLRQAGQPRDEVAKAFLEAAEIYQREGEDELAAHAYAKAKQRTRAADLYLKHARACLQAEKPAQAAKAFVQAGFQLRKAGRPRDEVAEVFATAAAIYDREGAQELAASAFMEAGLLPHAVSRYTRLNMHAMVGDAFEQENMPEEAAGAFWRASQRERVIYGPETRERRSAREHSARQAKNLFRQADKGSAQFGRMDPDL